MTTKTIAKRFLACFLALAMVISTTPAAFASTAERNTAEPVENNMISTEELGFTISFDDVETYVECGGETVEDGFFRYDGYVHPDYEVTPVSEEFTIGEKNETYFDIYRDGEFDYSFEFEMIPEKEQSSENPWGAGAHKINVNLIYGGEQKIENVGSFDYIIKAIPISGLYFDDITLTENTNGEIIQEDGGESWYKYDVNQYTYGFTYQDEEYMCSNEEGGFWFEAADFTYFPTFTTNQSAENVWTPDNDNCVITAHFGGHTAEFKAVIEPNPITGISFTQKSYEVIQGTCQDRQSTSNGDGEVEWEAYNPHYFVGLNVSLENGETVVLKGWQGLPSGDSEEEEGGESIAPYYETNETYENQWDTDTTDAKIYAELLGYKAEAAVAIVDSPVSSFTVPEKIDIIENSMGSYEDVWEYDEEAGEDVTTGEKWFCYDVENFFDNAEFTVQFKDGDTQILRSLYDSIDYNGVSYDMSRSYTLSADEPWETGGSYPVTFSILGKEATTTVNIVENPIKNVAVETVELQENTNGSWEYPEEGDKWYYYYPNCAWRYVTITLNDDSTQEVTNRYYVENEEDEEGGEEEDGYHLQYKGFSYPIEFEHNQYETHWTVGSENVAKVSIAGYENEFNVTIAGSPVTEFVVPEEINVIQHTCGYYEDIWGYDEESGEEYVKGKWFLYEGYEMFSNSEFTVQIGDEAPQTLKSIDDTVSYNGKSYSIEYDFEQYSSNPWEVGESYPVTFSVLGAEATTMIHIIESPIDDIQVVTEEIVKNTNGYWRETEDGEWYDYYTGDVMKNATVTFKEEFDLEPVIIERSGEDDDSEPYITFDGQRYYVSITDNQSYENQWTVGSDNTATIRVAGFEKEFAVTIVDTPIESIAVDPVTIIEGTKQCTDEDVIYDEDSEDENWIEYTKYDESYWNPAYTVTMKDGYEIDGKKVLSFESDEVFVYDGNRYYPTISSDQSYENKWDEPGAYTGKFYLMGAEADFTVNIIESPVQSIEVNEGNVVKLAKDIDGYMIYSEDEDGESYEYFWYSEERMVTNYTVQIDGKTYKSDSDGDILYKGNYYSPKITSNQSYENQWELGKTYDAEFSVLGAQTTFQVQIVETVVGDIIVNDGGKAELIANLDGYESEYEIEDGDDFIYGSYFHYAESAMVKSFSVTINGEVYQSDEDGKITYNGKTYWPDVSTRQSYKEPWKSGRGYLADFTILGETVKFPVQIITTPVEKVIINDGKAIELIENADGYWDEDGYFCYNVYRMLDHYSVVIDGKTYTCDEDNMIKYNGRYYECDIDSNQSFEDPWEVGTHEVTFKVMGYETTFPVKVVEAPANIVAINGEENDLTLKVIENTYGEWNQDDEEAPKYYYYYLDDLIKNYTVEIGGKKYASDKYGCIIYNGREYSYRLSTGQNDENQWKAGNTYDVEFSFMGKTKTIHVEILENPIESISVNDMEFSQFTNGYYSYYYDEDSDEELEWYRYDLNEYPPAYTLTLKEKFASNGNTTVEVAAGEDFEYQGVFYSPIFNSNQSYKNQWTTETPNSVTADFGGVTSTFNVTLTEELPFTVKFEDMTVVEKTNGHYRSENLDEYRYILTNDNYTVSDKDGKALPVEKEDEMLYGTSGFFYDGIFYPIYFSSNQDTEPFAKDKDNLVTCKIGNEEFTYKMKLKDSKVTNIQINDVTMEENRYQDYSIWSQDIAIVVTIDGTTKVIHSNNDTYRFEHNGDWYDIDYFEYQYDNDKEEWIGWKLGSNKATVVIGGVKADFNVHIVCANQDHAFGEGVMNPAATCTTGGVKTFTCKDCGFEKKETYNATNHNPGPAATCTTPQTCKTCSAVIKVATGHVWTEATCTTAKTCSICKTTSGSALGHKTGAANVTVKATATKAGTKVTSCTVCGTTMDTITIKPAKVTLSKTAYNYTGKKVKAPTVRVKTAAGKTISSKYYTVTKPKNATKMKDIGRYTYTVKFKSTCPEYKGSIKLTMEIKPNKTSITSNKAAKKAITVKWKRGSKSQVTGYEVMVATNSKFSKNKKTATVKGYSKTSYKMTKLKAKTKYYVRVRTYKTVKGVKIYSDWSKVKTIKTK